MKRPKLLFKVNRNNRAKVYVGGKWQKDVSVINILGEPWKYTVVMNVYKRKNGALIAENGELAEEIKTFHIGG